MENLDLMTKAEEELIKPIIDVQCLFEFIDEEYQHFYDSEIDVDLNRLKKRISDAKKLKLNYLTILN